MNQVQNQPVAIRSLPDLIRDTRAASAVAADEAKLRESRLRQAETAKQEPFEGACEAGEA